MTGKFVKTIRDPAIEALEREFPDATRLQLQDVKRAREITGVAVVAADPKQKTAPAMSDANATPPTVDQMLARIKLLSGEMDANDEENRDMQREIDELYTKIDAAKVTAG